MDRCVVAMDQGTTSSRAVVFDSRGKMLAQHGIEFAQIYPQPGWVEHDPRAILDTQLESLRLAVRQSGVSPAQIAAVGLTNQRETTLLWDRSTGLPVHNAIVWQCRRSAPYVEKLRAMGLDSHIRQTTGLIPDAYFSATKLAWLLDTLHLRERARAGELCFGTVDTWLAWHMVAGRPHVTDVSNASRTMLLNIHTLDWDDTLLDALDIPRAVLPRVVDTAGVVGDLDAAILGRPIPLAAMAGDQQAALFGQACHSPGMVKNTYGTGCFLLMHTGEQPVTSENGLLSTVAWRIAGKTAYALEGSVFVAGAALQWLRDEMGIIQCAADSEALASSIPDNGGVYLVPAFTGLGAPYWDMYARGTLLGLTRGTGRAHVARAALEAIAYQSADLLRAMAQDSGVHPPQLRVDGGASANGFLLQFQADMLGIPVLRPRVIETTALGAALLAGLAVGVWPDMDALAGVWQPDVHLPPRMDAARRQANAHGWTRAVARSRGWIEG
ncbi:MAG: glycerol kinase GlpK [Oscillospiraceae bacterium]|jgi:glycerol kinase|nr:glycerol kinase GlpK [Oscillospiraceae bacterium]